MQFNPILNKYYILKDTMIVDGHRRLRMEIAIDNSVQQLKNRIFLEQRNQETLANEGIYGVDNPQAESFDFAQKMLQIVGYFIVSCLKRRDLLLQLQEMSSHDPLTKLGNRFAMDKYLAVMGCFV